MLKGRQSFRKIEQDFFELKSHIIASGIRLTGSVETTIMQITPLPSYTAYSAYYTDNSHNSLEALIVNEIIRRGVETPTIPVAAAMANPKPSASIITHELISVSVCEEASTPAPSAATGTAGSTLSDREIVRLYSVVTPFEQDLKRKEIFELSAIMGARI